jgi:hypothetical protein
MEQPIANRTRRPLPLLAAALVITLLSTQAQGQTPDRVELAQRAFDSARQLMGEQRFAEACAKFAESQALDPGGGTILNLGICRENEGRSATAVQILTEALAQARADGRSDRIATAEKHLAELTPRLSHLSVSLWPGAPVSDVKLELDGAPLDPELFGKPLPLDPGTHRLRASQPGHEGWNGEVTLGPLSDSRSVEIPPLRASASRAAPAASVARPALVSARSAHPPRRDSTGAWGGYALVSVGGVALAAGAFFGVQTLVQRAHSDRDFDGTSCATASCVTNWNHAKVSARLSDVALGVGLVAVGVGGYLLLRPRPAQHARASWTLSVGGSGSVASAAASCDF